MKHLDLSQTFLPRHELWGPRSCLAPDCHGARPFLFFCLLKCGKVLQIEKHLLGDHDMRLQIMLSLFKYALHYVHRATILGAESAERQGQLSKTVLCSLWHGIKPLQEQVFLWHGLQRASSCIGAEALGVGWAAWASRTQIVHRHLSCFLSVCGQE